MNIAAVQRPNYGGKCSTIKLVQKSIPKLRSVDGRDVFLSTALENYGGALVQISEEIWPDIVDQVKVVEIVMEAEDKPVGSAGASDSRVVWTPRDGSTEASILPKYQAQDVPTETILRQDGGSSVDRSNSSSSGFSVTIRTTSQKRLKLDGLYPSSQIERIMSLLEAEYGVPAILQRLELCGKRLQRTNTLEQSGITEWMTLDLFLNARQCMIFIIPHLKIDPRESGFFHENIVVHYSVDRAWELSALYPSRAKPCGSYIQAVTWDVDVMANRSLFDHASQTEVRSIFWDGISKPPQLTVPDLSLSDTHLAEHPLVTSPLLEPGNSVAVPVDYVGNYISTLLHKFPYHFDLDSSYE
ncbi:hypothetical protein FRC12_001373 [Ceratobasidium sp. 428]|nr:hypothetical protein FRC12_001373 [Ceratobasidium sp. 428]